MTPVFIEKDGKTYRRLKSLEKQARKDKVFNVARRIRSVILNMEGFTAPEIAGILNMSRCQVSEWIRKFRDCGVECLKEGFRSGRPSKLSIEQINQLIEMLHDGPKKCGLHANTWSASLIKELVFKEFKVEYHPCHIRKILHFINFSLRNPQLKPICVNFKNQLKWEYNWYTDLKKMRWLRKPA